MNNVKLLDCTLRDGGYINNWVFGNNIINMIANKLNCANIDYIELGYLEKNVDNKLDSTKFNSFEAIKNRNLNYKNGMIMIDYGKFPIEDIPVNNGENIFGIRVAFSKKDLVDAINFCRALKLKGYNVFVQPMVTLSYSPKEIDALLNEINELEPYAVYIVDSFGSMNEKNVIDILDRYNKTLNNNIKIGFHCHNNLQLAYSNAITFINNSLNRDIIIDSSVYGIGRGAGNLSTELITSYLNSNFDKKYNINFLLEIVDNYLHDLKNTHKWGYCFEYYLSATNNCHPNYATFLSQLHTINFYDMQNILSSINDDKKYKFDKEYIYDLYTTYMNKKIDDSNSYLKLKTLLNNKKIFLIGSGISLIDNKEKILNQIDNNTVLISVNHMNSLFNCDYVFVSNKRRFLEIDRNLDNLICTSNIENYPANCLVFDYLSNLATEYENSDNSLLLLLNILIKAGIAEIYLAGFDGFNMNNGNNYYNNNLAYVIEEERMKSINRQMSNYLNLYNERIRIKLLTKSNYFKGGN